MNLAATFTRSVFGVAFALAVTWTGQAHAQGLVGTWSRTDAAGKGFVMTVERCCAGGLRFTYQIPPMGGLPAATLVVESPMDGTDVPIIAAGKPTGQAMAIKRVDEHRYTAVLKVGGQPYGRSTGTISADRKALTVETVSEVAGGSPQKTTETWVRK